MRRPWILAAAILAALVAGVWMGLLVWDECRLTNSVLYCLRVVMR